MEKQKQKEPTRGMRYCKKCSYWYNPFSCCDCMDFGVDASSINITSLECKSHTGDGKLSDKQQITENLPKGECYYNCSQNVHNANKEEAHER